MNYIARECILYYTLAILEDIWCTPCTFSANKNGYSLRLRWIYAETRIAWITAIKFDWFRSMVVVLVLVFLAQIIFVWIGREIHMFILRCLYVSVSGLSMFFFCLKFKLWTNERHKVIMYAMKNGESSFFIITISVLFFSTFSVAIATKEYISTNHVWFLVPYIFQTFIYHKRSNSNHPPALYLSCS